MPNTNHDRTYYELAEKLLNGTITPEEQAQFFEWYNKGQDAPIAIPVAFAKDAQDLKQRIWSNIQKNREPKNKLASILSFLSLKRTAAAAIIFLVIGCSAYFLFGSKKSDTIVAQKTIRPLPHKAILPGGNKATLTLADGSIVALDDANNGTISSQGNTKVIKLKSGLLAYQQAANAATSIAAINILATPRGGQYQVELPDGTKVWLNASSSLKYPTFFSGKERMVELTGEGYFEVAKNKDMPFKVKVKNMEVAVLGTHFNIMAYTDESTVNTTLLEGSVKINTQQISKTIVPGQQAKLSSNGKINVVDADIEETMAWKNGFFQFNSADMQTIIRQINRWYDVDIVYNNNVDAHFTGTISRSVDAEKVLKKLQLTGAFKYDIKNKQVFITQ